MSRLTLSGFRISSEVRSVIARNWIDLKKLNLGSFRVTVRIPRKPLHLGPGARSGINPSRLKILNAESRRVTGVRRACFDLARGHRPEGREG